MNNEEYLKQIVREAVEDVLYEFKSDIEYETKKRLLKDRESGKHEDPKFRKYFKSTNKHMSYPIPSDLPRSDRTVFPPDPHQARTMRDKVRRDNTNNSHIERFDNKMRNMDTKRKINKMFDQMLDK